MKKVFTLIIAAAMICGTVACSEKKDSDKKKPASSAAETTTVTTTEETTTTTKAEVTTTKATTTTTMTTTAPVTTTAAVNEEEKKALMAAVPQEAITRAEKYLTYSANMDYAGIMKSIYPKELDEVYEANGNYEAVRSMFGEMAEDDPNAVSLEFEMINAQKLDESIIKDTDGFLKALDNGDPKSPVEHSVTDGFLITLSCRDKKTSEKFTRDVGVVLVNDSEWVITMFTEDIEAY